MQPLLVWILGSFTLVAASIAVFARRPIHSSKALVAVIGLQACSALALGAWILALEMLLAAAALFIAVFALFVRSRRLRHGPAGRSRSVLSRMIGIGCAVYLVTLLLSALAVSPVPDPNLTPAAGASFGLWMAFILAGSTAVGILLVVQNADARAVEEDR